MRNARIELLAADVPLEIRPPRTGREYLALENLDAVATVTYSEDRFPVIGTDAGLPPFAATNDANRREWLKNVPQGTIWLLCANAVRVKIVEA